MDALYERDTKTFKGKVLDTSMVEGAAYVGSWIWSSKDIPSVWEGKGRGKNLLDGGYHAYDTYETKDGKYMAVGALEPQFYEQLLVGLDLSDVEVNKDVLEKRFKTKTRDEWEEIFDKLDACATPVLDLAEAHLNKHNQQRKSFFVLEDGKLFPKMNWHNIENSEKNMKLPNIGENTLNILLEMGYTLEKIRFLESENVVHIHKVNSNL
jgi:alpha-methylacyl-CoA racemase